MASLNLQPASKPRQPFMGVLEACLIAGWVVVLSFFNKEMLHRLEGAPASLSFLFGCFQGALIVVGVYVWARSKARRLGAQAKVHATDYAAMVFQDVHEQYYQELIAAVRDGLLSVGYDLRKLVAGEVAAKLSRDEQEIVARQFARRRLKFLAPDTSLERLRTAAEDELETGYATYFVTSILESLNKRGFCIVAVTGLMPSLLATAEGVELLDGIFKEDEPPSPGKN